MFPPRSVQDLLDNPVILDISLETVRAERENARHQEEVDRRWRNMVAYREQHKGQLRTLGNFEDAMTAGGIVPMKRVPASQRNMAADAASYTAAYAFNIGCLLPSYERQVGPAAPCYQSESAWCLQ